MTALNQQLKIEIEERKRLQSEQHYIFSIPLGLIMVIGTDSIILRVSSGWENTLGYASNEMIGKSLSDFLPPEDSLESYLDIECKDPCKNIQYFENRYRHKDGSYRTLEWSASKDVETGLVYGVARDITEQYHFEKLLSEARDQIEAASKAKSAFLANIRHEIRSPMNAIMGFTWLLKEKIKEADYQYYLSLILSSGESMLSLINELLDRRDIKEEKGDLDPDDIRFAPATLLIADNGSADRQLIVAYLTNYGFNFLEAKNGNETVDLAGKHIPNLVLMDLKMPVLDGWQVVKSIRADHQTMGIPIIAMTASVSEDEESEIRSICDGYLRKPIGIIELVSELTRFLKHSFGETTRLETPQIVVETKDMSATHICDPALLEKLPDLINVLQTNFLASWKDLEGFYFMKDIKEFVANLEQLTEEYNIEMLTLYCSQLSQDVARYDIDNLKRSLSRFPELIEKIKNLAT